MTVRLTRRGKYAAVGATVLAGFALGVALPTGNAAPNVGTPTAVEVSEDSPDWNCWTMGNQSCGDLPTIALFGEPGVRGVVLPKASDGIVYTAWSDGMVTGAGPFARESAWRECVDRADGGDASLFQCDEDFQQAGDRFTR